MSEGRLSYQYTIGSCTSSHLLSAVSAGFAALRSCLKLLSLFFAFFSSILILSFSLASALSFNCGRAKHGEERMHGHMTAKATDHWLCETAKPMKVNVTLAPPHSISQHTYVFPLLTPHSTPHLFTLHITAHSNHLFLTPTPIPHPCIPSHLTHRSLQYPLTPTSYSLTSTHTHLTLQTSTLLPHTLDSRSPPSLTPTHTHLTPH